MRNNEIKNEKDEIKKWENKTKWNDLKYETNKFIFDFQEFQTIRSFGDSIYTGKINIEEAKIDQNNLLKNMVNSDKKSRLRSKEDRDEKRNTFDSVNAIHEGREWTLNAFRSGIFPVKETKRKRI